jgi:serine/threonine protein kinase
MMITPRIRLARPVQDVRAGRLESGSARLWVAEHQGLATHVEVTFASSPTDSGAAAEAESFLVQASITAHINEPHVVRIFEHGDVKGVPFIVTELLEGRSLRQRALHGPASLAEVESVVSQACDALGKAHSLGVAHGNLRLDCLFATDVGGQPFWKIAGFGAPAPEGPSPHSSPEELLLGTSSDAASDLWALAVSLYELLTTTLPFEAATAAGVTVAICNAQFARPSHYRADLPASVDEWFGVALAKDKSQRFGSAAAFARSFAQALAGEAVTPRAPGVDSARSHPLELAPLLEPEGLETPRSQPRESAGLHEGRLDEGRLESNRLESNRLDPDSLDSNRTESGGLESDRFEPGRRAAQLAAPNEADDGEVPSDDSLEMDDGEEDEKTVRWDLPDEWSGLARPGVAAAHPRSARAAHAAAHVGDVTPTRPPRLVPGAPVSVLPSTLPPPTLEPSAYLESPYIASVASALAVPRAGGPESVRLRLAQARPRLSFMAEKSWLAAAAFAAGVAVTWFAYDPEPSDVDTTLAEDGEADLGDIRTVSVDDLPTVAEDLAIIRTSQLPRAEEEGLPPVAATAPVVSRQLPNHPVRAVHASPANAAPAQKVQALSPVAKSTAAGSPVSGSSAAASKAPASKVDARSNCSPPYYFDVQGIRRLKPECLSSSGAATGPYGAVLNTGVAAKSTAPAAAKAAPAGKQARAAASCTPPYYFDGNIRRIKLECL